MRLLHRDIIERHPRVAIIGTMLACITGVCLISYFALMHQSLRLDESQSLWQTSHSFGTTLRVVAEDVHVPLYHVILHFWQLFLGNSVTTTRLLSLMFFLMTIPLFYLLARQVLTRGWALFALIMFSFMPFLDWYSTEARMYTLLALMATLSQFYFIKIMTGHKKWRAYGLTAMIGAYSHYFFSFNLLTQGIFYLLNRKRFPAGSFKKLVAVAILVGVALSPWLYYFHSLGSGKNTTPSLMRPSTVDFFNAFSQFFYGFQNDHINTILVSCWPILVLVAFFAIKRGQKLSLELSYLITAAFVPVIIAYLLSFVVNPFFLSRYMISCVAPLIIVIVWLVSNYSRRLSLAAATLIIFILALSSVQQVISTSTPVKEDYQAAAQDINRRVQPQDIVVVSAPFTIYPFEYYYRGPAQMTTLPVWDRQASGAIPSFNKARMPGEIAQVNANHHYAYVLFSQDQGYQEQIKQYYLHHYRKVSQHRYAADVTLYVFEVGYVTVPPLGSPKTIIPAASSSDAQ